MKEKWNVTLGSAEGKPFINVYHLGKRYRYWNGKTIGVNLKASDDSELLLSAFKLKMLEGWRPTPRRIKRREIKPKDTLLQHFENKLEYINTAEYSFHYKRDCKWIVNKWKRYSSIHKLDQKLPEEIQPKHFKEFVCSPKWSARTQKNVLTYLKILTKDAMVRGIGEIKLRRVRSHMHKPISNPLQLLEEIKSYDKRLYLACLLTYGCLLRPHQEVRLLKWSDIDFQRKLISLSGKRNKSGRNRIIPMPQYIVEELLIYSASRERDSYVLSDSHTPYNRDFLSLLWSRFRKQSVQLESGVTLYSWRHHGAIKVFEKTGSLQTLQQVMGHSDMKVSLTYLRGLEVKQLDVKDLPDL